MILRNKNLKFINKDVHVKVTNNEKKFSNKYKKNQVLRINIAHNEGNYFTDPGHLKELKDVPILSPIIKKHIKILKHSFVTLEPF